MNVKSFIQVIRITLDYENDCYISYIVLKLV